MIDLWRSKKCRFKHEQGGKALLAHRVKLILRNDEQVALIKPHIGIDVPYDQNRNRLKNVILVRRGLCTKRKWMRYNWSGPIRVTELAGLVKGCYGRSGR